jgi:hypothetical protein
MPERSSSDLETERLRRAERAPHAPGDNGSEIAYASAYSPRQDKPPTYGSRLPIPCSTT